MPVKLGGKLQADPPEARIEIIPLIDIMFFLLAAFMLVSLSMVSMNSVKVNLPTAATASTDASKNIVSVSIDRAGVVYLDKKPVAPNELIAALTAQRAANDALRVFISGDRDCRHGDVVQVLDWVRSAGVDKIAFATGPLPAEPAPVQTSPTP